MRMEFYLGPRKALPMKDFYTSFSWSGDFPEKGGQVGFRVTDRNGCVSYISGEVIDEERMDGGSAKAWILFQNGVTQQVRDGALRVDNWSWAEPPKKR